MKILLRTRVLLMVAAINVAMFGVGLAFLTVKLNRERQEQAEASSEVLVYTLQSTIKPGGEINVASILRWPNWKYFQDALIVRANWVQGASGEVLPQGAFLNPIGRLARSADFDQQSVLRDVVRAVDQREKVPAQGGVAIPILDSDGGVWGGCWFALRPVDNGILWANLLPWFLLSTLLLTLGTFWMMNRFVLEPVANLAQGAQRVALGDLSVRLPEPARSDEVADLIRGFNSMTETVQGFNARLAHEVELATERGRRAEAAAVMQRRLAATGELAAGIAHEINNPLGGLLNAAEALSHGNLPAGKREQYHALLRSGLERIRSTVGQLLRFTPRTSHAAPFAVIEPVLDAMGLVSHRAEKQRVALDLKCTGQPAGGRDAVLAALRALPPVLGEQNELAQAVLNLLVNSLDALESLPPGRGRIQIEIGRTETDVVLSVEDNGPGVSQEALPRVADLFYTTKEVGKGTGLGLAIVHKIVANHGGRVHLSSPPDRGFKVEIVLPIWTGSRTP